MSFALVEQSHFKWQYNTDNISKNWIEETACVIFDPINAGHWATLQHNNHIGNWAYVAFGTH